MRFRFALVVLLLSPAASAQPADADASAIDSVEAAPQVVVPFTRWTRSEMAALGLEALPARTVREVAGLLPGVTANPAGGSLHARSRPGALAFATAGFVDAARFPFTDWIGHEPVFEVDGVRVVGDPFVPYEAVDVVEVLTSFVPASVGDTGAGVVRVETDAGGDDLRVRLEGVSSAATDPYGYTRLGGFAGGPLGDGRLGGFAVAVSWLDQADASPYGVPTVRLTDDAYAELQAHPQVLRVASPDGEPRYVPLPVEAIRAALEAGRPFGIEQLQPFLPEGSTVLAYEPIDAPLVLGPEAFETVRAKDAPLSALTLHGRLRLDPTASLGLTVGGALDRLRLDHAGDPRRQFARQLFDRDALDSIERDAWRLFGTVRQELAGAAFRLKAHAQRQAFVQHPSRFSADVRDALDYGDIDGEAGAVARRYFRFENGAYVPLYDQDGGPRPDRAYGTFRLPGGAAGVYQQGDDLAYGFGADGTVRLGLHHLQIGGEFEQRTHRYYRLDGGVLARYAADGAPEEGSGVSDYEDLPVAVFQQTTIESNYLNRTLYYGYDAYGLEPVSGENASTFARRMSSAIAPYRPIYYAGFLRDRLRWQAVTLDLGVRVEVFDANTSVLLDPFVTRPIVRVRDLDTAPAEAELDWAVYFDDDGTLVGFRDLEGAFYTASGAPSTRQEVVGMRSGQTRVDQTADPAEALRRTDTQVVWQPRLGLSLAFSPTLQGFAYYTRQARRPSAALYAPAVRLLAGLGDGPLGMADLRMETVESAGIGLEAQVNQAVRTAASVFLRFHEGMPVRVSAPTVRADDAAYAGTGTLTTYGVDLALAYDRAPFGLRAHYTLAFARGDDAVLGAFAPPLERDGPSAVHAVHTLDAVAGVRLPDGRRVLDGIHAALTLQARTGYPYTAIDGTQPEVAFREARLPAVAQVDLRVEKRVLLGPAVLSVFAWVENLLGTRNVLIVYPQTGSPTTDGFLSSPGGQGFLDTAYDRDTARFLYDAFTGGPIFGGAAIPGAALYGPPRQIRLGLRLGS